MVEPSVASELHEPAILVIDDEPASVGLVRIALSGDYEVFTATDGETGLRVLNEHPEVAVAIVDQRMPGMSGTEFIRQTMGSRPNLIRIILTGYTDLDTLIEAINEGRVYRYLTKPWRREDLHAAVRQGVDHHRLSVENLRLQDELREANERLRLANAQLSESNQRLQVENVELKREARGRYRFDEIIGDSPALLAALKKVESALTSKVTVLVESETGTGKELIARALHFNGPRAEKPFIAKNCGAVSGELLYSELFGHKKGAFTGATEDRAGVFEHADGGTVFLDEIGECSPTLQVGLLRVLENGEITRLGQNTPRRVDVRIVAATNRNLQEAVKEGKFREDLYYRLSVFTIAMPPLRQRKEDIPLLAEHVIARLCQSEGKDVRGLTPESLTALSVYDFPGNVRELQNELHRAFVMADDGGYITPDLLSDKFATGRETVAVTGEGLPGMVERFEVQIIRQALTKTEGNQTRAAEELRIGRRTLIDKMQKYGIR